MAEGGANREQKMDVSGEYANVVVAPVIKDGNNHIGPKIQINNNLGEYGGLIDEMRAHLARAYKVDRDPLLKEEDLGFYLKLKKNDQNVRINDMLSPDPGFSIPPTTFLISGPPGIGKSTFCKKLARDWSFGKRDNAAIEFQLLFLKHFNGTEDDDLEASLKGLCQVEHDASIVDKALKHKDTKILLILDGYDQASSVQKEKMKSLVQYPLQSVFKLASIIVTINEADVSQEFFDYFDRHFILSRRQPTGEEQQVNVSFDKPSWKDMDRLLREEGEMTTQEEVRTFFTSCSADDPVCTPNKKKSKLVPKLLQK